MTNTTIYGSFIASFTERTNGPRPEDRPEDGYYHLEAGIRKSFSHFIDYDEPLFTTNVENLYDIFLNNIPAEARNYYNCNACRNFVNRYGGLVVIDEDGSVDPIMWTFEWPKFFEKAINEVYRAVNNAKVTGVFIPSEKKLGIPKTGEWTHMSVDVPKKILHKSKLNTAEQVMAEKKEDFKMLLNALGKYSGRTIETAVNLLRSNSLYRSEKTVGIAEWFLKLKNDTMYNKSKYSNIVWKYVATAPAGFCHISSSMIGTLLDDIEAGYDYETVKARFDEKMNPLKYQRPKAAPSVGNVKRAEEIIAKLGMANSLKRRFARLEELKLLWRPTPERSNDISTGVFAGIKTKESRNKPNDLHIPKATIMTWEKFRRTVLPNAKKIELAVTGNNNSYAALVTAEDPTAPPIIQWDIDDPITPFARNPFNWYLYSGGSSPRMWNLIPGYAEVTGITLQPNMYTPGFDHQGKGVMFVLKDCKDKYNKSLALFPETLKGELREIRSVIEEYSRVNKLSGIEEASACGLLLQESNRGNWDCLLKVTTDVGVSMYKLDRWD